MRWIITLPTALIVFAILIAVNVVQALSLLVYPFSQDLTRKINRLCASFWWGLCVYTLRYVCGFDVHLTGDAIPRKESAILICNHLSGSDIPVLFYFAIAKGRLGDMKWFVKDVLKFVPGIGWGMWFLGCIFVKRDWTRDKKRIERTFFRYNRSRIPFWLISFSEGTRQTPAKLARSQAFAREKGRRPTANVMLPRPTGFVASVQGLSGQFDAVYDTTIAYQGSPPSIMKLLSGRARPASIHVRRFTPDQLPQDQDRLREWVFERFEEKDRLLENFKRSRGFSIPSAQPHSP